MAARRRSLRPSAAAFAAVLAAVAPAAPAAARADAVATPGASIAQSLPVSSSRGGGSLLVLGSRDLGAPQPDIVRAVILLHGRDRDAAHDDAIGRAALDKAGTAGAGTLLLAPRFAAPDDPDLPPGTLRWHGEDWTSGGLATAPAAIGSMEALDALLSRLSDRALFPHLRTVVLAGHSAGAQLAQRYAVLGHAPDALAARGIALRFLVANPSSYSYFTADRPTDTGGFAPYPSGQCPRFDDWKYGMHALPDYAGGGDAMTLERAFVQRDVTYLLGTADTDPALPALDKSCAAEAQGPNHLLRGRSFYRFLRLRHPLDLDQYEVDVPGVGHDAEAMLTSPCALAALFDAPVCGHVPPPEPSPAAAAPPPPRPALRPPPARPHPAPPRRIEPRQPVADGSDWQPGGWEWDGRGYRWVPGHAVRRALPRPVFVPASWQFDGIGWVWVPAHWRASR